MHGAGPRWDSSATVAIIEVVTIHSGCTEIPQRKPPSESTVVSRAPVRSPPPAPIWWASRGARPPISEKQVARRLEAGSPTARGGSTR